MNENNQKNGKVLITGGSGFLGLHLALYLTKLGYFVRIIDIVPFGDDEYPSGIEFIKGDIRDRAIMEKVIEGVDFVIHAAAALPLWSKKDIYTTNIDGTRNILETAWSRGVKRVIYVSSTAVYGIPKKHPIEETDPRVGVGHYGITKIAAEKLCEEFREKGLIVPIVRPKTFIGEMRLGVFQILYDWVESGKRIPMIGSGNNRYQLLEVVDLCEAIYLLMTGRDDLANDTFNVGASEFKTVKEDLKCLCDFAKSGARTMSTPAGLVKFFLRIFEILKISPLYQWIYGTADKDSFVSTQKIKTSFDWRPKYSNCEALIRSYKWYLDNKASFVGKEGVTHRVGWSQGVLKLFKKII